MLVATLITVFTSALGIAFILALAFLIASTLCAWLLYAGGFGKGKMKNLRLYIAYSKIMNTITIVLVSIIGAVLVAGCVVLTLMSDMIVNDVVPMLEEEVKPYLEEFVSMGGEIDENAGELEEIFAEIPQEIKDAYGIKSPEDMLDLISTLGRYAGTVLDAWDDIIEFLSTGFLTLTVIVAVVYVVLIVALCFVSSALKRTSKYIKAFANDVETDRKVPGVALYIGGSIIAIGGLLAFAIDPLVAITTILQGAVVILFAIFFKQLKDARYADAPAEEALEMGEPAETVEVGETAVE